MKDEAVKKIACRATRFIYGDLIPILCNVALNNPTSKLAALSQSLPKLGYKMHLHREMVLLDF
jgi:hypothetical protein